MDDDRTLRVQALIDAYVRGDDSAAEEILHASPSARAEAYHLRHANDVYRAAFRVCRSREDAEEATQQAFLALYLELKNGKSFDEPVAWVCRAARNIVLNRIKSVRRHDAHREHVGRTLAYLASLGAATPEVIYAERRRRVAFMRALRALPPAERALVHARLAGLTFREIAERHGLPDFRQAWTTITAIIRKLTQSLDE